METIGLIILNYNSANDTVNCVRQLLSFHSDFHIIVVDNCSTDNSYRIIQKEFASIRNVDIIQSKENNGYSAGNNIGIKYAVLKYQVDILGILNPDVIIPNVNVIKNMAYSLMSEPDYAIIGGMTLNSDYEYNVSNACWNIPSAQEIILNHALFARRKEKPRNLKVLDGNLAQTECIAGCFFLAKASVMKELDYLDENVFLYNEENILGIKCKHNGYKEIIALDQFYIHNHNYKKREKISFTKKILVTKNGYISRKYLCAKYYNKKLVYLLFLIELMNRIYLAFCYCANILLRR